VIPRHGSVDPFALKYMFTLSPGEARDHVDGARPVALVPHVRIDLSIL